MLVSKTNKIAEKEITTVLGPVSVKVFESAKWAREKFAINLLEKKVIINFSVRRVGLEMKDTYFGIVVVAEDPKPFWETIYCKYCGMENKHYYKVCIQCGKIPHVQVRTNLCKKCGHLNSDDSRFCSRCGKTLVKERKSYEHLLLPSLIILSTCLITLLIYFYVGNVLPLAFGVFLLTLGTLLDITIGIVYFKRRKVKSSLEESVQSAPYTISSRIQEGTKYCKHCGKPNNDTAQSCTECGNAIL